jgi:hypothetical protein
MLISVYGDASADETQQRVFSVSAILGTRDEWAGADALWRDATRGEVFHAADWEREGRHAGYKAAAIALAKSPVAGLAWTMDLAAFKEFFPNQLPDAAYFACLTKAINGIGREWRKWNERVMADPDCGDPFVDRVVFTFDRRQQSNGAAGHLYSTFINQPEWRESTLLDNKVSFACRTNPMIQMADLLAREGMKELDRHVGPIHYPERKSKSALARDDHFRFIEFRRDYFQRWAEHMPDLERETGFTGESYRKWLFDTGRVQNGRPHDNWANRALFMAFLDVSHTSAKNRSDK